MHTHLSVPLPLVSVIVVTLGHNDRLFACLSSVFAQTYSKVEVVLVNKGLSHLELLRVRREFPSVRVIAQTKDFGYPQAANKGVAHAKGSLLFLLNDDAVLEKNVFAEIVPLFAKNDHLFACQPCILQWGTNLIESEGFFYTWYGFGVYPHRMEAFVSQERGVKDIFGATAAALMIDRNKYVTLGGFDEDFFLYQDDLDLCFRARIAGFTLCYQPAAHVYHERSMTTKKMRHETILFHSFKNRIAVILKCVVSPYVFVVLFLHALVVGGFLLAYLFRFRLRSSGAVFLAVWWNMCHCRMLLRKRKEILSLRSVSTGFLEKRYFRGVSLLYAWRFLGKMFQEW